MVCRWPDFSVFRCFVLFQVPAMHFVSTQIQYRRIKIDKIKRKNYSYLLYLHLFGYAFRVMFENQGFSCTFLLLQIKMYLISIEFIKTNGYRVFKQ